MTTTFGIEEEFVLLDPLTLSPADRGAEAIDALAGPAGTVTKEFFAAQIEYASPVLTDVAEATTAVREFRRTLARWARTAGVIAAGTGTPFRAGESPIFSTDARYARIAGDIAGLAPDHHINGLHVHVGVPDRDAGVRASNGLRAWVPVLLAISANSPFWAGADTGFDSWRAMHSRRWTTFGIPPRFDDAADYARIAGSLAGIGVTSDEATLNWSVRLSAHLPTVEIRVFDAQLDPNSTVALALITRALVDDVCVRPPVDRDAVILDAALWHSARHGVRGTLLSPASGTLRPAADVIRELGDAVRPRLHDAEERARVDDFLHRVRGRATGASAQRAAADRGVPGLADLYRSALTGAPTSALVA